MFYEHQSSHQKNGYKNMLCHLGGLSSLFSESDNPFLHYRALENTFCKYFKAVNLSRTDCSIDAKKGNIGIGLKTWVGSNDQKIAEFGKLREDYMHLVDKELVTKISELRNERIRITKNLHNISELVYHIIKRTHNQMQIIEYPFDLIDIDKIKVVADRGNSNNTYFTDGKHTYHFSTSKNTLYMLFDNYTLLETLNVSKIDDPYSFLLNSFNKSNHFDVAHNNSYKDKLCLRLYSNHKGIPYVPERSGLNLWNANGRKRNKNEVYIPYPAEDRKKSKDFFPQNNNVFNLVLPDGTVIPTKICQQDGKSIMSNPNKILGEWLLRKVFGLSEGTIVTYSMLVSFGIDSVVFTKNSDNNYSINFAKIGTYENFQSE